MKCRSQIESQGLGRKTRQIAPKLGSVHRAIPFAWYFSNSSNAFTHRSLPAYFSLTGLTPSSRTTNELELDRLYQKIVDDLDSFFTPLASRLAEQMRTKTPPELA